MTTPKWTSILGTCAAIAAIVYVSTYHPNETEPEAIYSSVDAPILKPGQRVKVLSWNVQYMAGKNYVFYYDTPNADGPDSKPQPKDIAYSMKGIAELIKKENPDIILLQEIDTQSKRTYFENQIQSLLSMLPDSYKAHAETFYWKNAFNPHPKVLGSNGMKLAVLSKYRITQATRHRLPSIPQNPVKNLFDYKRAILEVTLPVMGQKDFIVLNTHLSAFAQGSDHMSQEVQIVKTLLEKLEKNDHPWILGGDFNLLLPGQFKKLQKSEQYYYQAESELKALTNSYTHFPTNREADGPHAKKWYTHFTNDPSVDHPDRILDYLFNSSNLKLHPNYKVIQNGALDLSDHFPIVGTYTIPRQRKASI